MATGCATEFATGAVAAATGGRLTKPLVGAAVYVIIGYGVVGAVAQPANRAAVVTQIPANQCLSINELLLPTRISRSQRAG